MTQDEWLEQKGFEGVFQDYELEDHVAELEAMADAAKNDSSKAATLMWTKEEELVVAPLPASSSRLRPLFRNGTILIALLALGTIARQIVSRALLALFGANKQQL